MGIQVYAYYLRAVFLRVRNKTRNIAALVCIAVLKCF